MVEGMAARGGDWRANLQYTASPATAHRAPQFFHGAIGIAAAGDGMAILVQADAPCWTAGRDAMQGDQRSAY
jgi:hypothetical protein